MEKIIVNLLNNYKKCKGSDNTCIFHKQIENINITLDKIIGEEK